jgi:hypothetical protein
VTTSGPFTNPEDPIIALLADQIADRLAQRLGPRLADIIEPGGPSPVAPAEQTESRDGLWTARHVAAHYRVDVRFVYQHADELGCARLGGGPRPRLRFDPGAVRQRWPAVGGVLPVASTRRPRPNSGTRRAKQRGYELLEFDRET